MASIKSSNNNGAWVSYTYDDLNRLSTATDSRRAITTTTNYTDDLASNAATVKYPKGLTSTFTYDSQNRLTELSTTPVADYKYTLRLTGIRTEVGERRNRTVQWSYDGIYRLNNESVTTDPNNVDGSVDYMLDPVGNRSSDTSSLGGVTPGNFDSLRPPTMPPMKCRARPTTLTPTRLLPAATPSLTTRRTN
jgi:YD repeat-containing protein